MITSNFTRSDKIIWTLIFGATFGVVVLGVWMILSGHVAPTRGELEREIRALEKRVQQIESDNRK